MSLHTLRSPTVPRAPLAERLLPPFPPEFFRGADWILPLLVTLLGGLLRFWNLGRPDAVVFDETYYAKDAWSMYVDRKSVV